MGGLEEARADQTSPSSGVSASRVMKPWRAEQLPRPGAPCERPPAAPAGAQLAFAAVIAVGDAAIAPGVGPAMCSAAAEGRRRKQASQTVLSTQLWLLPTANWITLARPAGTLSWPSARADGMWVRQYVYPQGT